MVLAKRLLERVELAVLHEALDRQDLRAVGLDGEHDAGARGLAIEQDRARAADATPASVTPSRSRIPSAAGRLRGPGPAPAVARRACLQRVASGTTIAAIATIAKSPWRRANSSSAKPAPIGITGRRISERTSSDSRLLVRDVRKRSFAFTTRSPFGPLATTSPSSAVRTAGYSADGSAWAIEPPMVPRVLIGRCPTHFVASLRSGSLLATTGENSIVRWRVIA